MAGAMFFRSNQLVRANGDGFWSLGVVSQGQARHAHDRVSVIPPESVTTAKSVPRGS